MAPAEWGVSKERIAFCSLRSSRTSSNALNEEMGNFIWPRLKTVSTNSSWFPTAEPGLPLLFKYKPATYSF
jgi:hypothetical protein